MVILRRALGTVSELAPTFATDRELQRRQNTTDLQSLIDALWEAVGDRRADLELNAAQGSKQTPSAAAAKTPISELRINFSNTDLKILSFAYVLKHSYFKTCAKIIFF